MKEIELTQGKVAIVDDEDYEALSRFKWYAWQPRGNRTWYAVRHYRLANGKQTIVSMHRAILEAPTGAMVDHINGEGLDNRRQNVRLCNRRQNRLNSNGWQDSTSGFKGVTWHKQNSKWQAQIGVRGKNIYLGSFLTIEDAARRYDEAAREYFGDFARTNFE